MLLPPPVAPGVGSRAKGASEQKCHIPAPLRPPLTGLSHRGHGVRKGMFPWNDSLGRHVLPPGGSAHPANLWKLLGAILPRCLFLSRLQAASSSNFSTLHVFQIRYRELSPLRDTPRPPDHPTTLSCWKRRNQVCLVHVSYVRRHIGTWCAPRLPERADWVQWDSNPIPKERGLKSVEKLRPGGKKTSAMIARCRLHV
jgi:hypothetical protein